MESNDINEAKLYLLIGERLKRHRIERGNTQAWLAERVGMLRSSITNIESGRQKTPLYVLYALCHALNVDPLEILPTLDEVRLRDRQDVTINEDHLAGLPPKTAEFLRGAIDDSARSTP